MHSNTDKLDSDYLRLYLPCSLPEGTIRGNGEKPARIAYIGHLLSSRPYDGNRDYITLNKTRLRETVSYKATEAAFSTFGGMIEVNHNYTPGVKAKGYRWSDELRKTGATAQSFYCPRFKESLKAIRDKVRGEYNPLQRRLDDDLKGIKLEISNLPLFINNIPPKQGVKSESHRRTVIQKTAEDVMSGYRGIITGSETTGRIHCLPNRLSTHLRSELTLHGSDVVEIDLANSQPFFLATMFESSSLTDAVTAGEFYERINVQLATPLDLTDDDARGRFKQDVLSVIYATPNKGVDYTKLSTWKQADTAKAMEAAYSGITAFIDAYRRTHGKTALPIAMQRLESSVFIDGVLATLQTRGIPAIPIHDSVMCRMEDASEVEGLVCDALIGETGLNPIVKRSA